MFKFAEAADQDRLLWISCGGLARSGRDDRGTAEGAILLRLEPRPGEAYRLARIPAALRSLHFVGIGFRGRRRGTGLRAGVKAGVAVGFVVAILISLTFLAMNNAFLDTVSQQHDKRVAFAASGWISMRAYLSVKQVEGLIVLIPVGIIAGATLGLVGAGLAGRRQPGRNLPG